MCWCNGASDVSNWLGWRDTTQSANQAGNIVRLMLNHFYDITYIKHNPPYVLPIPMCFGPTGHSTFPSSQAVLVTSPPGPPNAQTPQYAFLTRLIHQHIRDR